MKVSQRQSWFEGSVLQLSMEIGSDKLGQLIDEILKTGKEGLKLASREHSSAQHGEMGGG